MSHTFRRTAIVFALLGTTPIPATQAEVVFYVNSLATGANNGTSWSDAFTDLETAIRAADSISEGNSEIWVATGVYRPSGLRDPDDVRSATFQLRSGVAIYGGFLGGEQRLEDRNPDRHVVVLSGDLLGNDASELTAFDPTRLDNAYNVETCTNADRTAILDGVIISDGYACITDITGPDEITPQNSGAGMFSVEASPTIRHCVFRRNATCSYQDNQGGGILNIGGSPHLTDCTFEDNSVFGAAAFSSGGGMSNLSGSPTLIDCVFKANIADGYDSEHWGGAIDNFSSSAAIIRCVFANNQGHFGGAVSEAGLSGSALTDCTFTGNWSHNAGGAVSIDPICRSTFTRCRFHGNTSYSGGGVLCDGGTVTFRDCSFIGNDAGQGGGLMLWGNPSLVDCSFAGNTANQGAGVFIDYGSSPRLGNCRFDANVGGSGGALYLSGESTPRLTNCAIIGNVAWDTESWCGGGGVFNDAASPTFTGCLFAWNSATGPGGAIRSYGWSSVACNLSLTNCTFAGNSSTTEGDTLASTTEEQASVNVAVMHNCILWDSENGITGDDVSTTTITHSDVRGGWPGTGNIDADPLFADPDGPDNVPGTADDRFQLSIHSPCVDAGNNGDLPAGFTADLDGRDRFVDIPAVADTGVGTPPIVDMGAYERFVSARPDMDVDGDVDLDDLSLFEACVTGPALPVTNAGCLAGDFDGDRDVDQSDFGIFQKCYDQADSFVDPTCGA